MGMAVKGLILSNRALRIQTRALSNELSFIRIEKIIYIISFFFNEKIMRFNETQITTRKYGYSKIRRVTDQYIFYSIMLKV